MPLMGLAEAIDGACNRGRWFACDYMLPSTRGSCLHPYAPPLDVQHNASSLVLLFFTTRTPVSPSGVIHTKGPVGRGRRYEKWHRRWSLR
ncbi:hypothetical protein CCMA1212_005924 [Trichoderma ghanense]|uniref:Uncharacterized protein n=1 Tax=Trichoderma ghanense TaxID=65468 RepID=A0ABY2H1L8_9HYPO